MAFDLAQMNKVVVTGGAGFLGKQVVAELKRHGMRAGAVVIPRSADCDLRVKANCDTLVAGADLVIHLAARVGGIGFNQRHPGELFYDNAMMGINMIEASRSAKVKKMVVAGTICAYPRYTPVPFKEDDLWIGYPEETNAPYGIAKKSLLVMLQAYRQQYGFNGIFLLPVNLYGPEDNFHLENSHVIPALVRKFCEAQERKDQEVVLWGDGSPTREFLYVEDAARGIVAGALHYNEDLPVNLGSSQEISILSLAELVKRKVGYEGKIVWDKSRPNGQERRKLDVSRAKEKFAFSSTVSFDEGLEKTIRWWQEFGSKL